MIVYDIVIVHEPYQLLETCILNHLNQVCLAQIDRILSMKSYLAYKTGKAEKSHAAN